jgi:hypothetical protein
MRFFEKFGNPPNEGEGYAKIRKEGEGCPIKN